MQIQQALTSAVRLELLPKSTIDIFVTIIENDGIEGCIAAGSVAASVALADAGIEMLGLVASCSTVCPLPSVLSVPLIYLSDRLSLGRRSGWTQRSKKVT